MTPEEHEVSYATNSILRVIHDLPEAAEIALDELRRDPLSAEDQTRLDDLHQRHGGEVSSFYKFFGKVINDTKTFVEIDFDPVVDEVVERDDTQTRVIEELYARYRANYNPDDIAPEQVVALSNRANLLRAVASIAIMVRVESKPTLRAEETQLFRSHANGRIIALPN